EKGEQKVILDTKWKVFSGMPSDSDIQQMFVYCKRLKNENSIQKAFLVYPGEKSEKIIEAEEYHKCIDSKMGIITVSIPELLANNSKEFTIFLTNLCPSLL
ncbi:MAG TPA: hypothetical protein PL195_05240, partial [bacterium]|nr:hypothetical protein [bacterium]